MKHRAAKLPAPKARLTRRVTGVLLWAGGIAAGLIGGNYGLPVALALFVIGFFVFVSAPASRH
jgi:4-hydroxybenzoate polyprenyltransferase